MALCVCEYACGSGCVCGPPTHCPGVPHSEGEVPQSLSPSSDAEEERGMAGPKGEREDRPETSTNFSSFREFSAPRHYKALLGASGLSLPNLQKRESWLGDAARLPGVKPNRAAHST